MMSLASLFGPIGKENCVVFQVVSAICLIMALMILLVGVLNAKKNRSFFAVVATVTSPLAMYYVYRLLYSMCIGSL